VDDQLVGITLRLIRVRKHWRQEDLAAKARVSRSMIARIEHGRLDTVPLGMIRRVAAAIDARFDTTARRQGGDLGRLISARHAGMHEVMAQIFANHRDWVAEPEVSFSIYRERGIIDILAWHPTRRILLVIELKTEFVDIVAVGTGWSCRTTGQTDVLAAHESALRAKFPADGRQVRSWLRKPIGTLDALGFLPYVTAMNVRRDLTPIRRVNRPPDLRRRA
jgi:transcriptional regulator with XRE-family HTH domain